jgi:UDP-N-acetylglucosamine--N-acetylmuramyl-(pentapeptide) pyrophosphoryl-undecaprenol N-acetylglucosamine transferase
LKRVYIGCFGSGFGHATRMLEVGARLERDGVRVGFSSSGEVARHIRARGFPCNDVPLADVKYTPEGGVSMKDTVLTSSLILTRTWRGVGLELANMRRFAPDAVLSDSVLSTMLAGRMLGLHTVTVLNQLRLETASSRRRLSSKLLADGTSLCLQKLWGLSDSVLVPDMPPPYTISELNVWNNRVSKARYIGLLAFPDEGEPDEAGVAFASDSRPKVYWQISGPRPTRPLLVKAALQVAGALSREFAFCISAGDPVGSTAGRLVNGVWFYEWCRSTGHLVRSADVVISRAGHGAVAQAARNGKPALLIPIPNQPEQNGNASKCERLGFARVLQQGEVDAASVHAAVTSLLSGRYAARAARVASVAAGPDAVGLIAESLSAA